MFHTESGDLKLINVFGKGIRGMVTSGKCQTILSAWIFLQQIVRFSNLPLYKSEHGVH